jgi:hypothetical protein
VSLEIDGLAGRVLGRPVSDGNAPALGRADGSLLEWEAGLSSQTGASQPGILLGSNDDISQAVVANQFNVARELIPFCWEVPRGRSAATQQRRYDEVAHHSGLDRADASDALRKPTGGSEGSRALAPFSSNAPAHWRLTDGFAHVADIMVNSFYGSRPRAGLRARELISLHRGLGGQPTRPLILYPTESARYRRPDRRCGEPARSAHRLAQPGQGRTARRDARPSDGARHDEPAVVRAAPARCGRELSVAERQRRLHPCCGCGMAGSAPQ